MGSRTQRVDRPVRPLENRYRFVFYDQRGSLRSPAPDSSITFDRHVEDLELLRRELNVETITTVGHSMGAILASAYAAKYPDRVRHLLLLAPAYLKNPLPKEDQALLQQRNADFQTFVNRPAVATELSKYGLDRTDRPLTSVEETARFRVNLYRRMLYDVSLWPRLTGGRALYKARVGELTEKTYPASGWNYIQEFSARQYPVGIIVGDHDFVDFGNGLLERWRREAPRVNVTIIRNAGHLLWIDQPETLAQAIARHLGDAKTSVPR
jgi:proline iminopeptidase